MRRTRENQTPQLMEKLQAFWKWPVDETLPVEWGPRYAPHLVAIADEHLALQTLRAWISRDWLWSVTDPLPNGVRPNRPTTVGLTEEGRRVLSKRRDHTDA